MMGGDALLRVAREGLLLVLVVSAPPLLASVVVGLLVSLLQAVTQVQEQTLSFVPKMIAVFAALAISAPWIGAQLIRFTKALLELVPRVSG